MLDINSGTPAAQLWSTPVTEPACRLCGSRLHRTLIDLGSIPLANRTIATDSPDDHPYPLHVRICDNCTMVQLSDIAPPATAASPAPPLPSGAACQTQARRYAEAMRKRLRLEAGSLVIEIGPNDRTLLRHLQTTGVRVLAVETSANNTESDMPTEVAVFNTETAMGIAVRYGCADLVVASNVLQQAPDLFDFAASLASIMRPNGVLTLQVPHLLLLVQKMQFDAFRHDCYTYLSLRVLEHVLRSVGLRVFDAECLPDEGGSLRIHACHVVAPHPSRPGLKAVRLAESFAELERRDFYTGFSDRVAEARKEIRDFLHTRRAAGRRVAAYGAVTRGGTLLNCCGLATDEIAYVADPDPATHFRLMPGSRIPILPVETLLADPPDDVLILPWPNVAEIAQKLITLRQHNCQLWTPIPRIARF